MEQDEIVIHRLSEFAEAFQSNAVNDAARIAQSSVDWLKAEMLRQELEEWGKNHLFVMAVFWRSLFDLCILRRATMEPGWENDGQLVDYVWTKLWDFKDRFEYSKPIVSGSVVEVGSSFLEAPEQYFFRRFGPGKYLSAEILIRKRQCSVCKADLRTCNHVTGRLYGGRLCLAVPVDFEAAGASVVDSPKDPRCRIWSWNYDAKEGKFSAPVMTCFRLDDFSDTEDWITESPRLTCDIALSEPDFLLSFFRKHEQREIGDNGGDASAASPVQS